MTIKNSNNNLMQMEGSHRIVSLRTLDQVWNPGKYYITVFPCKNMYLLFKEVTCQRLISNYLRSVNLYYLFRSNRFMLRNFVFDDFFRLFIE